MNRRHFLSLLPAAGAAAMAADRKPNIVLIVADDLGYGELGCQGNGQIPTPHIDSIARNGVRFTNGYVSAPVCSPSRAGLMTGRYQTRFGHELNAIGRQNLETNVGLPAGETTMAEILKAAGYRTALTGKWHLGGSDRYHPTNRGFEEFYGFLHEGHFYVPAPYAGVKSHLRAKEPPYDDANPLLRGREAITEKEYLTTAIAREATSFIERNRRRPFFLYAPFNSVHSPMQATEADLKRFAHIEDEHRRVFAAMLASLDDAVGRILSALRNHGLERDTLVVFLSDNGGPVAELTSSNAPLRGQKGQLYEGGIRIPFLMQWPGRVPAGRTVEFPVISCDILPTVIAAAGAKSPAKPLDGVDLLPFLAGAAKGTPHATLFWRYGRSGALRQGQWKVVQQLRPAEPAGAWQLYDLGADLSESKDLAASQPEKLRELTARWAELNAQMVPPLWGAS